MDAQAAIDIIGAWTEETLVGIGMIRFADGPEDARRTTEGNSGEGSVGEDNSDEKSSEDENSDEESSDEESSSDASSDDESG